MTPSFNWQSFRRFLRNLRTIKSFVFYILPFSLVLGLFLPNASTTLNSLGLTLIQLISFPAIPLVLSAVIISTFSILSLSESAASEFRFTRRLFLSIVSLVLFVSCFALLLSLYQKPGILSPDARLSIGTFMLDVTDIKLRISSTVTEVVDPFAWAKSIIPNNIVGDASTNDRTLKVITGSILFGWGLSLLPKEQSAPLLTIVRSVYDVSVKLLDELLLIAPLVIICLIAGAFSTISSEMVVALLNLTICMLLASLVCLGVSRLIVKRFTTSGAFIDCPPIQFSFRSIHWQQHGRYPTIVRSMEKMGRNFLIQKLPLLSLLISRIGNIIYNIIAIMFALNLLKCESRLQFCYKCF